MSKVWEFALSAKQAVVVATCLSLAGLLFLVAGFAVGLLVASNREATKLAVARPELSRPALKLPAAPQLKNPEAAAKSPVAKSLEKDTVVPPTAVAAAPSAETKTAAGPVPGDKGSVPAPASAAAAAKAAPLPIRIAVQVGSFSLEDNARSVLDRLKRFGYPATSFPMTDARNRQWHVVQVGPYADYDDASRIATELSGKYRIEPRLVPQTAF